MSDAKWTGYLSYMARHIDINSELKSSYVPVNRFLLKGGATRSTDLSAARGADFRYKNITFYIPPTKDFAWHHLYEISYHDLPVSINFSAAAKVGKTITHNFYLTCSNARIAEQPIRKIDDKTGRMTLMVNLRLSETQMIYGSQKESGLSKLFSKTSSLYRYLNLI